MPITSDYCPMPLSIQDRLGQIAGRCAARLIGYTTLNALILIHHLLTPGYGSILTRSWCRVGRHPHCGEPPNDRKIFTLPFCQSSRCEEEAMGRGAG